jgi:hypothetical protein
MFRHLTSELKNYKNMRKLNVIMKSLMMMTALVLVSCNNDDGIECPEALTGELSATETEFSGSWEFTGLVSVEAVDITDDNTANPSTNIYAQYTDCQQDLVYDFMNNRNYAFKQGYVADDCEGKQTLTGTWKLTGKVLTFVANCASQNIEIEMSDAGDSFTYESIVNIRDVNNSIKTSKVTFTFEKAVT